MWVGVIIRRRTVEAPVVAMVAFGIGLMEEIAEPTLAVAVAAGITVQNIMAAKADPVLL